MSILFLVCGITSTNPIYYSYVTHPDKPAVKYPECFQGKEIPIHGPSVARLIEDRVSAALL